MRKVNVCSLGVQWKILQCEEVLTALFVLEQLEWVSSLIMGPFLCPLASPTVLPVLLCLFLSPTGLHCRANSWRTRDKRGGGGDVDRVPEG